MPGKDGMSLLYVPAGEFTMGREDSRDDEKPIHTVDLDAFWIDQTEVTLHMFYLCVNAGVCEEPSSKESDTRSNYPVINVSWNDANNDYCSWVDRCLPTEAEWEKAEQLEREESG